MFVIVGLGNPDRKYEKTRHNIGFDVIDALAEKYHISVTVNTFVFQKIPHQCTTRTQIRTHLTKFRHNL